MEVEEERDPRRRLVLRHRRYDGYVDLCIAGDKRGGGGGDRRHVIHVGLSALGVQRQIIQYNLLINSRIMSKKDNSPPSMLMVNYEYIQHC